MKKILIIVGIGVVLIISAILFMNVFASDNTKPLLNTIYTRNSTIVTLADQGENRSSTYSLKVLATNIYVVNATDAAALASYYKQRYGKTLKPKKLSKEEQAANPVAKLKAKEDGVDFDTELIKSLRTQLELNLKDAKQLKEITKQEKVKALMDSEISNTNSMLEQIKNLSPTAGS